MADLHFLDEIFRYKSVSVVGMEKNTGKTECLRFLINYCASTHHAVGITSIGLDGETCDQVTGTGKPEIFLSEGDVFVTSEKHYRERKLVSEILDISRQNTALGRLVTARVVNAGKVILSGPTNTAWLREILEKMGSYSITTTFVDGALSRKSLGSPAITESMILTTGAALSPNINELVRKTKFVYSLIQLDRFEGRASNILLEKESGLYAIDNEQNVVDIQIPSALLIEQNKQKLLQYGNTIFVGGIVGDRLLNLLRLQQTIAETVVVVKDFTKIFVSPQCLNAYLAKGGKLQVLLRPKLLCVCVNPFSPCGYLMDSAQLCRTLSAELKVSVYDIKKAAVN
jgi:hypothetical protein